MSNSKIANEDALNDEGLNSHQIDHAKKVILHSNLSSSIKTRIRYIGVLP